MERTREIAIDSACRGQLHVPPAGAGPGLLVVYPEASTAAAEPFAARFADEGYVALSVAAPDDSATEAAFRALAKEASTESGMGLLGFGEAGLAACLDATDCACAVLFDVMPSESSASALKARPFPVLLHLVGEAPSVQETCAALSEQSLRAAAYPGCRPGFFLPDSAEHDRPGAMMAHSRSLAVLRRHLGPEYDLEALWDAHTYHEFATRDVDATMKTMVDEPYVNHIPTMTGGVGGAQLRHFYEHHFVFANPEDTQLIPVSRTIGVDRVVDEMLFCFTHTREIPWMIPGIAPTGKYVEIPLVAIVNFRGDKLYHEHIYWDQASVLTQLGLLDPKNLPVAGVEVARKLVDETLPSNALMGDSWKGPG